jgi:hypothetical protein
MSIGRIGEGPAELDGSADNESADDRDGIPGLVNKLMSCFAPVRVLACRGRIESFALRASSGLRWIVAILLGDATLQLCVQRKELTIQSFIPFPDSRYRFIVYRRRLLFGSNSITATTITSWESARGPAVHLRRWRGEGDSLA